MAYPTVLDDSTRVCGVAARLLQSMLADPRAGYAWASREAVDGLQRSTLVGIQESWSRFWITWHEHRARPARCDRGAIFQALAVGGARDIVGWVVLQNGNEASPLVFVHELGHWLHRRQTREHATQRAELVDESLGKGLDSGAMQWTRASFINELGARHLAWLAESGAEPGAKPLPRPGALMACAVKIASYPEIYNDCGVMRRLCDRGDEALLRDQVGAWMQGMGGLPYFEGGSRRAEAHGQWLRDELELAAMGRHAPVTEAEGTL